MKKLIFVMALFCALNVHAQTYIDITFTGHGDTTVVSSVNVENLATGNTTSVGAYQTLRLTIITGINLFDISQPARLKIYPNPMTNNSIMHISPPSEGDASIAVFDMTGKQVAQIQSYLGNCLQEFQFSGGKPGIYLISVKGSNWHYSGKLVSNGKSNGEIKIEKTGTNMQIADEKVIEKDSKSDPGIIYMDYSTGDRLLFTGISGSNRYSTIVTDIPAANKEIDFHFALCEDKDGNNYSIVEIGDQIWMAENLKTTKYMNGESIETTTTPTQDISELSTPKYQWAYNGNEENVVTYGRLYTLYAAVDSRSVCPDGWYMPSDGDWTALMTYLGESNKGGRLKETGLEHWESPNEEATNETGFTALPAGYRIAGGTFSYFGKNLFLWSSTGSSKAFVFSKAWYQLLFFNGNNVSRLEESMKSGLSVRCIQGSK
jgi:uncharacterized protein (TIGR02145 family)